MINTPEFVYREGTNTRDYLLDYFTFVSLCTGGQNMSYVQQYSKLGKNTGIFSVSIRNNPKFERTVVSIPGYSAEIFIADSRIYVSRNTPQGPMEIFLQTDDPAPAEIRAYERLKYKLIDAEGTQQFVKEVVAGSFEIIQQAVNEGLLYETELRTGAPIIFPTEK